MEGELSKYLVDDALMFLPVLWVLGALIKQTPLNNWVIPWIILFFGLGLAFISLGFSADSFIQGVIVSGVAVFTHQLYKQTTLRDAPAHMVAKDYKFK